MRSEGALILGIETSCDETAAAVTAGGRTVLSNVIASQIDVHKVFGGVVPEIASRHHLEAVNGIVSEALAQAGVGWDDLDAIAVTKGPGLVGAVLIGLATAKGLAFALGKPLVGVHHIRAHICAAYLEHEQLAPPFLALVVSGGHTSLVEVTAGAAGTQVRLLGATRDDAVGEAYDKVARVLGLGYPGGPEIDTLAKRGDPAAVSFKRTLLEDGSLDFSFSGIKTGVMNYVHTQKQADKPFHAADVAASFQQAVVDVLSEKTRLALEQTGHRRLVLCGGVAANSALRARMQKDCDGRDVTLFVPSPVYCTDNAAMVACAGYEAFQNGDFDNLELDAYAQLAL